MALDKLRIDDPVGAISVHGVVGIWGLLAVCLSNGDAKLGVQLLGIAVIFAWVFLASLLVWFVLKVGVWSGSLSGVCYREISSESLLGKGAAAPFFVCVQWGPEPETSGCNMRWKGVSFSVGEAQ